MNILLSGVGGQGILFVTRILAELALAKDWAVIGAETHGMAQRGGSVVSHLKINQDVAAPLIRKGTAHLLLGFEESEGLRYVDYLRSGGRLIVNRMSGKFQRPAAQRYLKARRLSVRGLPASRLAQELGYPLGVNLILMGSALALDWLPFTAREAERIIAKISRPQLLDPNLASLRCGLRTAAQVLS